jgi:hypothetical protein
MNVIRYFKILATYWGPSSHNYLIIIPNVLLLAIRMPFAMLEKLIWEKKIKSVQIDLEPVFILGYFRSGTTHLQKLISLNQRHTTFNIFKTYFPDSFLVLEPILKPILEILFKSLEIRNPIHRKPFSWDLPGEEDIALTLYPSRVAFNWLHGFPHRYNEVIENSLNFTDEKDKSLYKKLHLNLVKKLSLSSKNKRVILKSPANTARIKTLLELYPNAKFIYIERDKEETIESNRYLWDVVTKAVYEKVDLQRRDEIIVDTMNLFKERFIKDRELISSSNLIELSFSELLKNPKECYRDIHDHLGLIYGDYDLEILDTYLTKEHGKYRGINHSSS